MSDITTTRIFTDGERGITAAKLNDIVASSTIQPAFYTAKPTAPSADPTDIALIVKAGAYAQVPISALAGSATQAQIWSTRLRSYNSVINPNFEVDQRNCFNSVTNPASGFIVDRWAVGRAASAMTCNFSGILGNPAAGGGYLLPGTSFVISKAIIRVTLTGSQASLAGGDSLRLLHYVEGLAFRELMSDVHSISLMVRSSVAGLNFGVVLRDPATSTKSLTKLCNIPSANTWTIIQLPNLPIWPSAGNFTAATGVNGYMLDISLAAGSTLTSPANDTWQNGNFVGAVGQSNFASSPVNSTFDIAFVQHEPGSVCSTLIDKPFSQNMDECLRYYQKTYGYNVVPGTVSSVGMRTVFLPIANTNFFSPNSFTKLMAKTPTVTIWDPNTAASPNKYFYNGASSTAVVQTLYVGDSGYGGFQSGGAPAAGSFAFWHHTADTGW